MAARDGYIDVMGDPDGWLWKPKMCVPLTFHLDKQADPMQAVGGKLAVVGRVLDIGPKDATLVLNGDWPLLRRAGTLVRCRASWWDNYGVGGVFGS